MSQIALFLYANYNEFFVLSDLFCNPTVYSRQSFHSFVYKFRGYNLRNVQMHDFLPLSSCNTSIFKHIKGCNDFSEYSFQKEEKCAVQHIQ